MSYHSALKVEDVMKEGELEKRNIAKKQIIVRNYFKFILEKISYYVCTSKQITKNISIR